ncbi:MAG TPA: response regulator [Thermodesulfobacteriota bacterium]|jgi:DNA-binding response OmpR family regulator
MKKILVVDDDPNIRFLYNQLFSEKGYEVLEAESGKETFYILNNEEINLVVLDIKLRLESGLNILQGIAKEFSNIPVVLCTAFASYQDDYTSWLADSYIVKSSNPYELLKEVDDVLSKRSKVSKEQIEDLTSIA